MDNQLIRNNMTDATSYQSIIVQGTGNTNIGTNTYNYFGGLRSDFATVEQLILIIRIESFGAGFFASEQLHKIILKSARSSIKSIDYFLNCVHNFDIDGSKVTYNSNGVTFRQKESYDHLPTLNHLNYMVIMENVTEKILCDIYRYFIAKMMGELIRYFNLPLVNLIIDYLE